jgi:hypothetical protein
MSDAHQHEIILRRAPGRDATSAELARARGDFRRQPHLTTVTIDVEVPAPAAEATPAAAPEAPVAERPSGSGEYGRSRLTH